MVNSKKISDGAEETYQYTSESSESVSENLSRAIRAFLRSGNVMREPHSSMNSWWKWIAC